MVVDQVLKDNATEVSEIKIPVLRYPLISKMYWLPFKFGSLTHIFFFVFFSLCLQTEVLGYLEKACQLVPDKGLSAECKEMVDSYFPILIGIIKGELVSAFEPFVQVITQFQF